MIKCVLFSGFLGAGKTTVLRRVLPRLAAAGRKVAVLVNDFGKIPIDGALLSGFSIPVREISGGSIFCVCKQAGLIENLTTIAREIDPELLLIEASGLAEPTDVTALLQNTFLRESYSLPRTITVVDALNYPKLSGVLRVLPMQVKIADVIILSKTDMVDNAAAEQLEFLLSNLNPSASIIRSDAEKLYGELDLYGVVTGIADDTPLRLCATATPGFSNFDLRRETPLKREAFEQLLEKYKTHLLRAKGIVDFGDERLFLDLVNGQWQYSREMPPDLNNISGNAIFFALRDDAAADFARQIKKMIKYNNQSSKENNQKPHNRLYSIMEQTNQKNTKEQKNG